MKTYRVTLQFDVSVTDLPESADLHDVKTMLSYDGYSDGRNSFSVELIAHGLQRHLENAIDRAVHVHYRRIHGNEMREVSPTFRTAVAVLEAEKDLKGFQASIPALVGADIEPETQEKEA